MIIPILKNGHLMVNDTPAPVNISKLVCIAPMNHPATIVVGLAAFFFLAHFDLVMGFVLGGVRGVRNSSKKTF